LWYCDVVQAQRDCKTASEHAHRMHVRSIFDNAIKTIFLYTMEKKHDWDEVVEKTDFSETKLPKNEYENCQFKQCTFVNADLSNVKFSDCEFVDCNLSTTKLHQTSMQNVRFKQCKLLGLHFDNCTAFLFSVDFEDCILNLSTFYKLSLKKKVIKNCSLQEVDFTNADLSGATFENCDLTGATFENTMLEKADFRTARNFSIDPEINKIKKARFSLEGIIGLLNKYDIEIEY
jgi:fluoroquinolone resistance protein